MDGQTKDFFHTAGPALLSGAIQAILFNPFDRALYVRVKFRRKYFLDRRNFYHPFLGFMNAAVYRTLVGASYVFWQDFTQIFIDRKAPDFLKASHSPVLNAFIIGMVAGSLNGTALNGMQVVKYRMWNMEGEGKFFKVAFQAYKENGICIFFRGIGVTIVRDCIFGVVYELCRRTNVVKDVFDPYVKSTEKRVLFMLEYLPMNGCGLTIHKGGESSNYNVSDELASSCQRNECSTCAFISNFLAALLASIMSAPFNYLRSVVYSTPSGTVPIGLPSLLQFFFYQVRFIYKFGESFTDANTLIGEAEQKAPYGTCVSVNNSDSRLHFRVLRLWQQVRLRLVARAVRRNRHPMAAWRWVNSRLNIGWGSVRVGLGMAVGQGMFYMLQDIF